MHELQNCTNDYAFVGQLSCHLPFKFLDRCFQLINWCSFHLDVQFSMCDFDWLCHHFLGGMSNVCLLASSSLMPTGSLCSCLLFGYASVQTPDHMPCLMYCDSCYLLLFSWLYMPVFPIISWCCNLLFLFHLMTMASW
jgi:hypothetical protein